MKAFIPEVIPYSCGETMRIITFKIDEVLLKRLDDYAIRNKMSRSEVIRKAIDQFLSTSQNIREKPIRVKRVVLH